MTSPANRSLMGVDDGDEFACAGAADEVAGEGLGGWVELV
jgi:hypothetical protein